MINRKDVMYKLTKAYTTEHNDGDASVPTMVCY